VPKTQNQAINNQTQKVNIQVNPDDNVIPFTSSTDNSFTFEAVVNGYTTQITVSTDATGLSFSVDETLKMLKSGALGKTDFDGDAEKILGNNSVADKSVFIVGDISIATKSAFELEATVLQKQKIGILMNEKILKKFGAYTIDKEKKQIVFN
jgi:hypothetical protein